MTTPAPTVATAPSTATPTSPWTQRWYVTCSYCGLEARALGYYTEPKDWARARYTTGGIACPACTPKMREAETFSNEHNEKATLATRDAYAPAYAVETAWVKANPRPELPYRFKNVLFSRETFIRRITCAGCGRVETREAHLGTVPTRPAGWRYAGVKRGHGPIICPDCEKTLEPYYVEFRAWKAKRDAAVGEAFRGAQKSAVKSVYPTYPLNGKK